VLRVRWSIKRPGHSSVGVWPKCRGNTSDLTKLKKWMKLNPHDALPVLQRRDLPNCRKDIIPENLPTP
jgi:hypothetical protein